MPVSLAWRVTPSFIARGGLQYFYMISLAICSLRALKSLTTLMPAGEKANF